ncbi:predicted protein [Histoplasma capsulatum H143]|uniref:Uncharacterized protein n=1 Tax=Ajellomyces capsulatus (strain H143) TaxID=544712 RepID=C6HGH5_AJECH|nr:predicted protein [Histoplasma capsulatum H143]
MEGGWSSLGGFNLKSTEYVFHFDGSVGAVGGERKKDMEERKRGPKEEKKNESHEILNINGPMKDNMINMENGMEGGWTTAIKNSMTRIIEKKTKKGQTSHSRQFGLGIIELIGACVPPARPWGRMARDRTVAIVPCAWVLADGGWALGNGEWRWSYSAASTSGRAVSRKMAGHWYASQGAGKEVERRETGGDPAVDAGNGYIGFFAAQQTTKRTTALWSHQRPNPSPSPSPSPGPNANPRTTTPGGQCLTYIPAKSKREKMRGTENACKMFKRNECSRIPP